MHYKVLLWKKRNVHEAQRYQLIDQMHTSRKPEAKAPNCSSTARFR